MNMSEYSTETSQLADKIGITDPDKLKIIQECLEKAHENGCTLMLHYWPFNLAGWYAYAVKSMSVEFPALLYHEAMIHAARYLKVGQSEAAASLCPNIPWIEDELENNGISENLILRIYTEIAIPYAKLKIRQKFRSQDWAHTGSIFVRGSLLSKDYLDDELLNHHMRAIEVRLLLALIIQCLVDSLVCCRSQQEDLRVNLIGGDNPEIVITPFDVEDDNVKLISSYHYSDLFGIKLEGGACFIKLKR